MNKNTLKHIVKCSICSKDVLDHMTKCPFCNSELVSKYYTGFSEEKSQQIKKYSNIISFIILGISVLYFIVKNNF